MSDNINALGYYFSRMATAALTVGGCRLASLATKVSSSCNTSGSLLPCNTMRSVLSILTATLAEVLLLDRSRSSRYETGIQVTTLFGGALAACGLAYFDVAGRNEEIRKDNPFVTRCLQTGFIAGSVVALLASRYFNFEMVYPMGLLTAYFVTYQQLGTHGPLLPYPRS